MIKFSFYTAALAYILMAARLGASGGGPAEPPVQQGTQNAPEQSESSVEVWSDREGGSISLGKALSKSNCVVRARCDSYKMYQDSVEYHFVLIEAYKGSIESEFTVMWQLYDGDADFSVSGFVGNEYILPLSCVDIVYTDSPYYTVVGHVFLSCKDGVIEYASFDGVKAQLPEDLSNTTDIAIYTSLIEDTSSRLLDDYIRSDQLDAIAALSKYIVKAVIDDEPLRSGRDRGIYTCALTQSVKGDVEDSFIAVFRYDSVEVGKEYWFFLTRDNGSRLYTLSSKNSIYPADSGEVTAALERAGLM